MSIIKYKLNIACICLMFILSACSEGQKNNLSKNIIVDSVIIEKTIKNLESLNIEDVFIFSDLNNDKYDFSDTNYVLKFKNGQPLAVINQADFYGKTHFGKHKYVMWVYLDRELDFSIKELDSIITYLMQEKVIYLNRDNIIIDSFLLVDQRMEKKYYLDGIQIGAHDLKSLQMHRVDYLKEVISNDK